MRSRTLAALAFLAGFAVSSARAVDVPVAAGLPAGSYALDAAHASLVFRVSHLGFSRYTARFGRFDARLELDPADPAASVVGEVLIEAEFTRAASSGQASRP